jgi:Stress responsive A/B Barrel Domain
VSQRLAHNVFFLCKDRSPAKVAELVAACHKYLNVQKGIAFFAAGPLCAELDREVNDRDWDVGLHLVFDTKADHDAYQTDATHNRFIDEMKANWAKVRVFDSTV